MKREIEIDADWLDVITLALVSMFLLGWVFIQMYKLVTLNPTIRPLGWRALIPVAIVMFFFLEIPDRLVRLGIACYFGAVAIRAAAQFVFGTHGAMYWASITSLVLNVVAALLVLTFFVPDARERIKIVEVTHNA